jgi:hypothetical protein
MASSPRRPVPGPARTPRPARPARPEPSWGRVLLNTVQLWASRRLRLAGFQRRPVRPRWLAAAVAGAAGAVLVILQFTGVFAGTAAPAVVRPAATGQPAEPSAAASRPAPSTPAPPSAQSAAVAWITGQVSEAAIVGCYPAMCTALQAQGVSASRLVPLGPEMAGVLRTDVIATPSAAGQRLVDQYAPGLIASFGTGGTRIEIRAVARGGAAAYQSAVRADQAACQSAGTQLLKNSRLRFSAADAAHLAAGVVDARLLATLAALSSQFKLRVTAFGDSAPGAPPHFREVTVASAGGGNGAATLAAALALVNQQGAPYRPARASVTRTADGQALLNIEFAAPNPLGLLTAVLTAQVQPGSASHG